MRRTGREEQAIRLIHSNLLYIIVAAVIIALIVLFNFSRQGLLGPIQGGPFSNLFLQWKISDHTSTREILTNQLTGTNDDPKYEGDEIIPLTRNADGSLKALPRYQGTLEYHAP